ncbi:ribosomal protein S18-alanine N-acetyltransferase [Streptomyces flavofungini]|uniref:Ribosomal protein S18-alanine N-acetyltransferase n=1 Tax=Streptomyces flavofungini TaxID=68200 RepID=A0ABS0X5Q8_9ACTN|nr:ribosomal protein S18-alanine N-acetyltransferase [Streptomyces flavofungini]MBJ3808528.1 ribosomal protein S18-alanine N-acetyltransferase [Streptomyces flavofungini]
MRWWDIDAVLALEKELFPDDAWSRGMFWSELAHARGPGSSRRYLVAYEGDRLVGYGGLAVAGTDSDGGAAVAADVQTIAVARDHWGTGLGACLLTELLRHATAFEATEVMLEVRVDNTRAQKLYQRFGFEPIGFRRGYYQPGNVDALVMRLSDPSAVPDCAVSGTTGDGADATDTADAADSTTDSTTEGRNAGPLNGVQGTGIHG